MLHVLRAYVGISYCKTGKVYNFPSSRPITQLVIFFLALFTMIIIMSMTVIVLLFVLRLVLFLGE